MLLALLLLHLTVLTVANPFHKYPYVFLLDVGNEEIEKVNTDQIRISKQGGSLALRYPAIGNGDNIAHVRVSGIDFGTNLKASIVDGGPGYQYVVLVLMGNPGVNFDAVITIQTVPKESDEDSLQNIDSSSDNDNQVSEQDDPNDSAEDLSDSGESEEASQVNVKENAEISQESSNVYSYAVNEALSGYGNSVHDSSSDAEENNYEVSENDDETDSKQQDIHVPYRLNDIKIQSDSASDDDEDINDEETNDDDESANEISSQSLESQNNDEYPTLLNDQNYSYENQEEVKSNIYERYKISREYPYMAEDEYPQKRFTPDGSGTVYIEEPGDQSQNLAELFDDDYNNDDDSRYSDKNNNNYFIDRNDGSAVEY